MQRTGRARRTCVTECRMLTYLRNGYVLFQLHVDAVQLRLVFVQPVHGLPGQHELFREDLLSSVDAHARVVTPHRNQPLRQCDKAHKLS